MSGRFLPRQERQEGGSPVVMGTSNIVPTDQTPHTERIYTRNFRIQGDDITIDFVGEQPLLILNTSSDILKVLSHSYWVTYDGPKQKFYLNQIKT